MIRLAELPSPDILEVLDSFFNKPVAIDENGVYLLDRTSRAPKIGYNYHQKFVPFTEVTQFSIHLERPVKKRIKAIMIMLISAVVSGFLYWAFTKGIHFIFDLGVFLAPIGVVVGLVECFAPLDTCLSVEIQKGKRTIVMDSKTWKEEGHLVLELIKNSGRPLSVSPKVQTVSG